MWTAGWVEPGEMKAITQGWSPSSTYQQFLTLWWAPWKVWTAGWVEPGVKWMMDDGDHHPLNTSS